MGKLKNAKTAGKVGVTGEIIKGGGDKVVDFGAFVIWPSRVGLCLKTGGLL